MTLPLILGGLATGGLGLLGNALTGGFSKSKAQPGPQVDPNAYMYGGSAGYGQQFKAGLADERRQAKNRSAPQMKWDQQQQAWNQQGQARDQQQEVYDEYRKAYLGQQPSVAEAQLNKSLQTSAKNVANQAASARGSNIASAQRAAAYALADAGQAGAADAAMLRAQEIERARAGAAGLATNIRGADLSASGQEIGRQQAIAGNELAQRQLNDAEARALLEATMSVDKSQLQAAMAQDAAKMQAQQIAQQNQAAADAAYQQKMAAIFGGIVNAGAGLVGQGIGSMGGGANQSAAPPVSGTGQLAPAAPAVSSSSIDWGAMPDQYGEVGQSSLPPDPDSYNRPATPMGSKKGFGGTDDPNSPYYNPWANQ